MSNNDFFQLPCKGNLKHVQLSKGTHCSAIGCTNTRYKTPHLSFFRCPKKDPERCRKWIINSRREGLIDKSLEYLYMNIFFCALHFEQCMFMNTKNNRLVWNAVPTLFDVPKHCAPKLATGQRKASKRSAIPAPAISDMKKRVKLSVTIPTNDCHYCLFGKLKNNVCEECGYAAPDK